MEEVMFGLGIWELLIILVIIAVPVTVVICVLLLLARSRPATHIKKEYDMFCSKCGTQNEDNAFKCVNCGAILQNTGTATASSPQHVSSHLVWAILVTLLCCLPFGIPAIVFAAQVNGKLAKGDHEGAVRASRNAKIWCWVAFATGFIVFFFGILAAIAVPQFAAYRVRSYNTAAQADLRSASVAQENYYLDNGTYNDSIEGLTEFYGYYPSEGVTVEIISAEEDDYYMTAFHEKGTITYQIIGSDGEVTIYSGY